MSKNIAKKILDREIGKKSFTDKDYLQQKINDNLPNYDGIAGEYLSSEIRKQFKSTNLNGIKFFQKNLKGFDFTGADLSDTQFIDCNLQFCNFTGANLINAYFLHCIFNNSYFEYNIYDKDKKTSFFYCWGEYLPKDIYDDEIVINPNDYINFELALAQSGYDIEAAPTEQPIPPVHPPVQLDVLDGKKKKSPKKKKSKKNKKSIKEKKSKKIKL